MKTNPIKLIEEVEPERRKKHPKCAGSTDYWGNHDCGYSTLLDCEDCKYGIGRKDPEAKCNQT